DQMSETAHKSKHCPANRAPRAPAKIMVEYQPQNYWGNHFKPHLSQSEVEAEFPGSRRVVLQTADPPLEGTAPPVLRFVLGGFPVSGVFSDPGAESQPCRPRFSRRKARPFVSQFQGPCSEEINESSSAADLCRKRPNLRQTVAFVADKFYV